MFEEGPSFLKRSPKTSSTCRRLSGSRSANRRRLHVSRDPYRSRTSEPDPQREVVLSDPETPCADIPGRRIWRGPNPIAFHPAEDVFVDEILSRSWACIRGGASRGNPVRRCGELLPALL